MEPVLWQVSERGHTSRGRATVALRPMRAGGGAGRGCGVGALLSRVPAASRGWGGPRRFLFLGGRPCQLRAADLGLIRARMQRRRELMLQPVRSGAARGVGTGILRAGRTLLPLPRSAPPSRLRGLAAGWRDAV